jgi:protein TonB
MAADFEVKNGPKQLLVRRKGTENWQDPSKLDEPVVVGLMDSDHKIYVVTKIVKPPRSKYTQDPKYPETQRSREGLVLLHAIVDDHGIIRSPRVDASPNEDFAASAIDAVSKWRFDPAKLGNEPIAVLIRIEVKFFLSGVVN